MNFNSKLKILFLSSAILIQTTVSDVSAKEKDIEDNINFKEVELIHTPYTNSEETDKNSPNDILLEEKDSENALSKESEKERKGINQDEKAELEEKNEGIHDFDNLESEEVNETRNNKENQKTTNNLQTNSYSLIELKYGDSNELVKKLKEELMYLGFAPHWNTPSAYYGAETVEVVKKFQTYYALKITGNADEITLEKIEGIVNSPFSQGEESAEIQSLKEALMKLGYAPHWNNPNDYYGPETVTVVKNFQQNNNLTVNGIIDDITYSKIETILNSPMMEGLKRADVKLFKENLMNLGFAPHWDNPNDYFGPETVEVVKAFQKYYGLTVNGTGDSETLEVAKKAIDDVYRLNDQNPEIETIKYKLMNLGFAPHWDTPSNFYGKETETVVLSFQKYYGLLTNGLIDSVTHKKINEIFNSPMKLGLTRPDISVFKQNLMAVGFAPHWNTPSDYFGAETQEVVRNFQTYYKLKINGIGNEETLEKLNSIINTLYQAGNSGDSIKKMKHNLMTIGFATHWNNPNDYYGSETVEAVKTFQKYYNLLPNGIIDSVTEEKINNIISNSYKPGDSHESIRTIKGKLHDLGFASQWTNPSNIFDNETKSVVTKFQKYYGLNESGIIEYITEEMIDTILNSHYSFDNSSDEIQKYKYNLFNLGFAPRWKTPSTYYGSETVEVVKSFQKYYGLSVNGIIDVVTGTKIHSVLNSPNRLGNTSSAIRKLKENLVTLGFAPHWNTPNSYFGIDTEKVVKDFQSYYGLPVSGIIEEKTLEKIKELLIQNNYAKYQMSLDEAVNFQMKLNPQTDKPYAYVSAVLIDSNGMVIKTANVRKVPYYKKTTNNIDTSIVGTLRAGTKVEVISKVNDYYQIKYNGAGWVNSAVADVQYYLNPKNFENNDRQKFQFLDLTRPSGATVEDLNKFLNGKGTLHGMGQAFIDAGRKYKVNEVYLLSHALLETGHGTSALARGIVVNGQVVYNMFGIRAVDNNVIPGGSQHAYNQGWTTPYKAIVGGASFIGNRYIDNGLNTLYKMRWNPDRIRTSSGTLLQYATDIGWASKQVHTMYNLYKEIGISNVFLEIPVYGN